MGMLALDSPCDCSTLIITTDHTTGFVDITERIQGLIGSARLRQGFVNVQTRHTTTAIVVNEHEPLLLQDFVGFLERAAPRSLPYRHDDETARTVNLAPDERPNGYAHCRALMLPTAVCLNVVDGRLDLGRWQRVFFVELDGPRRREISVAALGEFNSRVLR